MLIHSIHFTADAVNEVRKMMFADRLQVIEIYSANAQCPLSAYKLAVLAASFIQNQSLSKVPQLPSCG